MSYPMRKYDSEPVSRRDDLPKPPVRYEKKISNGHKRSCLIFSLKPKTAPGQKRIRLNGEMEK